MSSSYKNYSTFQTCQTCGQLLIKSVTVYIPYVAAGFTQTNWSGSCSGPVYPYVFNVITDNGTPISPCGPNGQYMTVTGTLPNPSGFCCDCSGTMCGGPYSASIDPVTLKSSGDHIAIPCQNYTCWTYLGGDGQFFYHGCSPSVSNPDTGVIGRAQALLNTVNLSSLNWGDNILFKPVVDTTPITPYLESQQSFNYACSIIEPNSIDPCSCRAYYTGTYTITTNSLGPNMIDSEISHTISIPGGVIYGLISYNGPANSEDGSGNMWWKVQKFECQLTGYSACQVDYPSASVCTSYPSRQFYSANENATMPIDIIVDHSSAFGTSILYWQPLHDCKQDDCPSGSASTGPTQSYACSCYPANYHP